MSLSEYLTPEHIRVPLTSATRDEAIRELITLLSPELKDAEKAYQAVLAREKIMTTGVGNGVAIPHCKNEACTDFSLALGIHPDGLDFNAVDQKPVHIIVLLIGPENNPAQHIKLLSRVSRLLNNKAFREELLRAPDAAAISAALEQYDNAL
ncbi:MAG: PTS sugar transporter subunit IIA [Calditrichaeota bacterium]|nr:MAG: PTS sugar transporter subunit IIA [Calditrichota bacterium]